MRYVFKTLKAMGILFIVLGLGINVSALAGGHKAAAEPAAQGDIVATAVGAGNFTTLVTAIKAAELVEALQGEGPYTVFAPTDEAFAKLPPETLAAVLADENLLKPENRDRLQALLLYHVVPGKVMSSDLSGTVEAETLQGSTVEIVVADGVTVNKAKVVAADIEASNGVIHVIDMVMLPPVG